MDPRLLILIGMILLSGVFSASETALVSLTNSKVDELVSQKIRNSKILQKLKRDPHKLLITILIGNNIVNVGASALAALVFTEMFESSGLGIATGVMTFLILVFGEITPKAFAYQHAVGFSLMMCRPIRFLQIILFPLVWFFDKIVDVSTHLFGSTKRHTVTEGEIVAMLKIGTQEGSIEKQERELIENVLEFNDIEVEEVMTPRVNIEAIHNEMTIQEAVEYALIHTHSRIPVYEGDMDNIVGIMTLKQLLKLNNEESGRKKIKNLDLMHPLEVPHAKKINKLFADFQRRHQHIAIVIDEHGGTAGLVTMEDLLEEIVGEIVDETDVPDKPVKVISDHRIIVKGTALVEDINDFFKIKVGKNDRDTVNALVVEHLHRFPREGDVIKFPKVKVTVLGISKKMVEEVEVTRRRYNHKKN